MVVTRSAALRNGARPQPTPAHATVTAQPQPIPVHTTPRNAAHRKTSKATPKAAPKATPKAAALHVPTPPRGTTRVQRKLERQTTEKIIMPSATGEGTITRWIRHPPEGVPDMTSSLSSVESSTPVEPAAGLQRFVTPVPQPFDPESVLRAPRKAAPVHHPHHTPLQRHPHHIGPESMPIWDHLRGGPKPIAVEDSWERADFTVKRELNRLQVETKERQQGWEAIQEELPSEGTSAAGGSGQSAGRNLQGKRLGPYGTELVENNTGPLRSPFEFPVPRTPPPFYQVRIKAYGSVGQIVEPYYDPVDTDEDMDTQEQVADADVTPRRGVALGPHGTHLVLDNTSR